MVLLLSSKVVLFVFLTIGYNFNPNRCFDGYCYYCCYDLRYLFLITGVADVAVVVDYEGN